VTWLATGAASPPSARMSATVTSALVPLRDAQPTRAPAWARATATARPIPWEAPVTTATRPRS